MQHNLKFGKEAEANAVDYFISRGMQVRARNYRFKRAEIDLIVHVGDLLLFVEVKARSSLYFGYPESFVRHAKCLLYQKAANEYIQNCDWEGDVRFDIVSVYKKNNRWSITHFKDAFY